MVPVCPLFQLDYIIPRLISCVFQSLPVVWPLKSAPSPVWPIDLQGARAFSLKAASASEAKKLSDLTAKGKGPCSVPLQTDKKKQTRKTTFGEHTHTRTKSQGRKKVRIIWLWKQEVVWNNDNLAPLVISCRCSFMWCGHDCSAGINQTWEQMASHSLADWGLSEFLFFFFFLLFSEAVIGLLWHRPEHANSHCHHQCAATACVVPLCVAHNVVPMFNAPFQISSKTF